MNFTSIHEAILKGMSEAVFVTDRDLKIQYVNPAAEKLTGYSWDESVGKKCHEIFCEQSYRCSDGCPLQRAMSDRKPILHREAETRTKNGGVRETQISISPFFDNNECVGVVLVIKDITELKKAEVKILQQNLFLNAVINALPHPFTVIDAETYQLKLANYAAYQGRLPEKLTCHESTHGCAQPCGSSDHPCLLEKVRGTGLPATLQHVHRDVNGKSREMEVHGFPIFDNEGKMVQMIEYSIDITERNKAAREREKLVLELQKALSEVKALSGLLPICSSCKKIRDDQGYWSNLELYISEHSGAEFSHGICPECAQRLYPEYCKRMKP